MHSKLLLTVFFVSIFNVIGLNAQNRIPKNIWQQLQSENFYEALPRMQELKKYFPNDSLIDFWFHVSMLENGVKKQSSIENILKYEQKYPEAKYFLGKEMYRNMIFDEANRYLNQYLKSEGRKSKYESNAKYFLENLFDAMMLFNDSSKMVFEKLPLEINTEFDEYAPVWNPCHRELYFTSKRPSNKGGKVDENGRFFEDIMVFSLSEERDWKENTDLVSKINSHEHDACLSISADGNTMLIYKTDVYSGEGDLVISHRGKNGWLSPTKLGININTEYIESSACLSADGETIIFSSNKPGGYGGQDLYKSRRNKNGTWGRAENLGKEINSSKDEENPFLSSDQKTLFFSSNGQKIGMGGFDLYQSKYNQKLKTFSDVQNLGYPYNTVSNDYYFNASPDLQTVFISTNRKNTDGQDILIGKSQIEMPKVIQLKGIVNCTTPNQIVDIFIEDRDQNKTIFTSYTCSNQPFTIIIPLDINAKVVFAFDEKREIKLFDKNLYSNFTPIELNIDFE